MSDQTVHGLPGSRKCPRCGTAFTCGVQAGQATCWCFDLPHVMKMDDAGEGCLCLNCLKAQIEAVQRELALADQLGSNKDD